MPWFIKTKDGERGPLPTAKLKELVDAGKLSERVMIRRDGQQQWVQAGAVESLFPVAFDVEEPTEPVEPSTAKRWANSITRIASSVRTKVQAKIPGRRTRKPTPPLVLQSVAIPVRPAEVVQVVEESSPKSVIGFGIASLILGVFSVLIFWLPYFGVAVACVACGLGIAGLILTVVRRGRGIAYSVAGTTVSFAGIVLGGTWTMLLTAVLSRASQVTTKPELPVQPVAVAALPVARTPSEEPPADALLALAPRHITPAPIVATPRYSPPAYVPPPQAPPVTAERDVSRNSNTTPSGKTIYTGPRGGRYHYSASGKKVYERKK